MKTFFNTLSYVGGLLFALLFLSGLVIFMLAVIETWNDKDEEEYDPYYDWRDFD